MNGSQEKFTIIPNFEMGGVMWYYGGVCLVGGKSFCDKLMLTTNIIGDLTF